MDNALKKVESVQGLGRVIHSIELRDIFAAIVGSQLPWSEFDAANRRHARSSYQIADFLLEARDVKEG